MKISLRKATKLRNKVQERVNELYRDLSFTSIPVNVFDPDPLKIVRGAQEDFVRTYALYTSRVGILFELRELIGVANATSGISDNLTKIAASTAQSNVIKRVLRGTERLSDDQITARVSGAQEKQKGNSYASEEITFEFLDEATLIELKNHEIEIRRRIEELIDQNEQLNNTVTITISDTTVTWLKSDGIL